VLAHLGVFLAAALTAFVTTPMVRRMAARFGAIDRPSDRKVHPRPTPTLGGIAIFLGVAAGLLVASATPSFRDVFRLSSEPIGVLVAGGVILLLGIYDDVRGLAAPAKIAGQILAGGILVLFGVQLVYFWLPGLGVLSLGPDLAVPLTLIWILVMVNAVNLIDGLDGLAAGVVAIAGAAFFVYAARATEPIFVGPSPATLFSAAVVGATLGFLPFNFNPAKIFMGDSGSMLLGLVLAAATISGVGRTDAPSNTDLAALSIPIIIPLLVLAIPLVDVMLAIVRRMRRRQAVFRPDKQHIHHRLLEIGHSHRQAVLLMYLWSALVAGSALAISFIRSRTLAIVCLAGAALVILGTTLPRAFLANGRRRASRHAARPKEAERSGLRANEPL
jgi:UDP-GlcNAc:undecaprenyl-phosphate GlcNAc-1-phosphate transferase